MATDATGTPTSPDSIPKYNTSVDAPSGIGFNGAMDAIQIALSARVSKPSGIVSGEAPVWNGSAWVRSTTTQISSTSIIPARTATTIVGLGTASDGAIGHIRAGSTPFDFVTLVYDATYAKWVSDAQIIGSIYSVSTSSTTASAWGALSLANNSGPIIPWRIMDTAGLKPQIRLFGRLKSDTGGDGATVGAIYQASDLAADLGGSVTWTGTDITVTGTSSLLRDSGWVDIPGGFTIKDIILIQPTIKAVTGGTATANSAACWLRWVG